MTDDAQAGFAAQAPALTLTPPKRTPLYDDSKCAYGRHVARARARGAARRTLAQADDEAPPLTAAEIDANFDYFDTEDYRIGYNAFMARRKPVFKGR